MESNQINKTLSMLPVYLLTIAFVVLKLCKVIDWSWWWVLSPLWIVYSLIIVASIIIGLVLRSKAKRERFHESRELRKRANKLCEQLEEIQRNRFKENEINENSAKD